MQNMMDLIFWLNNSWRLSADDWQKPSDLELVLTKTHDAAGFFDREIQPLVKMDYKTFITKLIEEKDQKFDQFKLEKLLKIFYHVDGIDSEIIGLLKEMATTQIIANDKIELDLLSTDFLAKFFLEKEKKNLSLNYEIEINQKLDNKNTERKTLGTYSTIDEFNEKPSICIYTREHLALYNDLTKDEKLYAIINTCYHELRHAIIDDMFQKDIVRSPDLLQMAVDAGIRDIQKYNRKKDGSTLPGFHTYHYSKIMEERMARIYGGMKALEVLSQYNPELDKRVLFKNNHIIKIEKIQKKVDRRYLNETKDRFTLSNNLLDQIITSKPDILNRIKTLNLIYNEDGSRREMLALQEDKIKASSGLKSYITTLESETKLSPRTENSLVNELVDLDQVYAQLFYYNFKDMTFEDFNQNISTQNDISSALEIMADIIEQARVKNRAGLTRAELTNSEWLENDKNLNREYKELYHSIQKLETFKVKIKLSGISQEKAEMALEIGGMGR